MDIATDLDIGRAYITAATALDTRRQIIILCYIHPEMLHGMGKLRRVQMLRTHGKTTPASNTGGLLFFMFGLGNGLGGQKGQRPARLG
jgi:hypothetical protein